MHGWRDIIRYRRMVSQLPQIREIVEVIGRLEKGRDSDSGKSALEKISSPLREQQRSSREVILPKAVLETGGLERSNELARMLPSELALLGHPIMRKIWTTRFAEQTLLTYEYHGVQPLSESFDDQNVPDRPEISKRNIEIRGPVIICLDSSASMAEKPEAIAKAVTLEAMRIANLDGRPCYLYLFGGPEELIEFDLSLENGRLGELLEFLQYSFHGGTDVAGPLESALLKLQEVKWKKADILLVSDGRFLIEESRLKKIKRQTENKGFRIHGLILGRWKNTPMQKLCNPIHRIGDLESLQISSFSQ